MHLQLILQIQKEKWLSAQLKAPKFCSLIKTSGVLLFQGFGLVFFFYICIGLEEGQQKIFKTTVLVKHPGRDYDVILSVDSQ